MLIDMEKIIILLALLLVSVSQGAFAQITIFGSVVDAKDGSGIPGVYVTVKDANIGGTTNSSGNFGLMNVPNDAILQVSYIGYKTVEIAVENQTRFEITLESDVQVLGDVVVTADKNQSEKVTTAFGIERDRRTLTYAVTQISGDELRRGSGINIGEGLIGKIAGLTVTKGVGAGNNTMVWLRGANSSNPINNLPLWVIDGVPIPKSLEEDPSSWFNIEDVESVTVLHGANAAILYGSEGAAGAIIITTKKR